MFRPDPKPVKSEKKPKSRIKPVSKAMSKKLSEYCRLKKEFIKGKICPIYPNLKVVDIHHMKGRSGSFLLNTDYWLAVSRKGHMKIELNPIWAKDFGYSISR